MIDRPQIEREVRRAIRNNPVTAIFGPRQCGKTTLAHRIADSPKAEYFDLEDPISVRRLAEPFSSLSRLRGLVVIDEIQRRRELFPVLRVLADRRPLPARFLVLGSASPELLRQGSETLAGRIAFVEMGGFELADVGAESLRKLWLRGGFPRAYLSRSDRDSFTWHENFVRSFLERDIGELGLRTPPSALRRLLSMIAHYHGQIWNASEISRSLGESHTTVKRHLDFLTSALMVRQLQPWYENLGKRQVKSPKVYFRDTGVLHSLLGISAFRELEGHPKLGASWEGLVVESVARQVGERNVSFWATHSGGELDLLVQRQGKRVGLEVKYADAPGTTKSMRIAIEDLRLDRLIVVYPGSEPYDLDRNVTVVPFSQLGSQIWFK